ncbi:M48 family metallopeptidase [Ruegeria sp. HKCCD7221]|uniref:M48 family metallopeptidase n=1 Tax=Ruegeria sp. HKCCD7221 TaxID=2683009 RepID=UPI0014887B08|nr:SprT family zinc-dependent metalloprotease [Ruegeria sp. HKCCD7221]
MSEFKLGNLAVPYSLKRSSSVTRLHIELTMDGMRITAPSDAEETSIEEALYRKRRWIVENHADLREKYDRMHKIARFRTGAKVPYWGRLARLTTSQGQDVAVNYQNGFHVSLPAQMSAQQHDDTVESALQHWMRARLTEEARRFVRRYAKRLETQATNLRISRLKTRWGSCGKNGVVTLDWHLVFGPKQVLEYVVAHELAHLVERNHDEAFWRTVRRIFGDYEKEHQWLTKNEHLLGYRRIPLLYDERLTERDSAQSVEAAAQTYEICD